MKVLVFGNSGSGKSRSAGSDRLPYRAAHLFHLAGLIYPNWQTNTDAVPVNTANAIASDPVWIAKAFKKTIEAGREAREIGLVEKLHVAAATSPLTGFLSG